MDPLEYLQALRRRWPIILVVVAVAGLLAWLTTPPAESVPEERFFTATHTLYDDPTETSQRDIGLDTIALLATTGEIPQRVADELGADVNPAVLASEVEVTPDQGLGTLTVSAQDDDGEQAAELANTFAEEILSFVDERDQVRREEQLERLTTERQDLEEEIRALDDDIADADEGSSAEELARADRDALLNRYRITSEQLDEVERAQVTGSGIVTLEAAVPVPETTGGIQVPRDLGTRLSVGILLGLLLGAGLAMFIDRIDTKIRARRDAERAFRLPVVTEVPKLASQATHHQIITSTQPASYAAESYRILRLSLQMAPKWLARQRGETTGNGEAPAEVQVVLVTSAGAGEGKTTTVANVAASFAEIGKRVLVIDADFRNAQQHRYFGVPRSPGVTEFLTRGVRRPALASLTQETNVPGVEILTNGTFVDNPGELIGPDQDLIAQARQLADIVVVDAGPVLAVNDPSALMPQADAVVVVARSGATTEESATRTAELLARTEAPVVGVALTAVPRSASGQPYYAQLRSVPGPARRWRSPATAQGAPGGGGER